jgi:hypothetical protein
MKSEEALAELLLNEPEIRAWLGLDGTCPGPGAALRPELPPGSRSRRDAPGGRTAGVRLAPLTARTVHVTMAA